MAEGAGHELGPEGDEGRLERIPVEDVEHDGGGAHLLEGRCLLNAAGHAGGLEPAGRRAGRVRRAGCSPAPHLLPVVSALHCEDATFVPPAASASYLLLLYPYCQRIVGFTDTVGSGVDNPGAPALWITTL